MTSSRKDVLSCLKKGRPFGVLRTTSFFWKIAKWGVRTCFEASSSCHSASTFYFVVLKFYHFFWNDKLSFTIANDVLSKKIMIISQNSKIKWCRRMSTRFPLKTWYLPAFFKISDLFFFRFRKFFESINEFVMLMEKV